MVEKLSLWLETCAACATVLLLEVFTLVCRCTVQYEQKMYLDHSRCCTVIVWPQLSQYGIEPLHTHTQQSVYIEP